jgi:hypothetical protein
MQEEGEEEEEEYLQETVRGTTTDTEDRQTDSLRWRGKEEETAATAATTTTEQIGSQVTALIEPVGKQHSQGAARGGRRGNGIDAGRVRDEMMFTHQSLQRKINVKNIHSGYECYN